MTPDDALELFAVVPIGILNVARDGTVRGGNFAASRLLDVPLKDFAGRKLLELAPAEDRPALSALLREERFDDRELPVRQGGKKLQLLASARPLPDGSLAIVVRDASVEAARQRKRAVQEKMASLGRLAAGVAHEFGNIMASLYGYAQLSARDASAKDALVEAVTQAAARAQQVTNALHAFEHAPSGELEPFDLAHVVNNVVNALRLEIERAQVKVERNLLVTGPVLGQREPIEEAVLAIVRNAVEACAGPSGVVTITLADEGERASLAVTDNGPGIPEEIRDRIFDPFFTTKGSLGGSGLASGGTSLGLGLAVAWNRVREHEGELEFDSQAGKGSTFKILLPRRAEAPVRRDTTPDQTRRPSARRRPRRSILVVDSNAGARELVEAILKTDHWVRALASGAEAIAAYDAPRAYDYVVLDLELAGPPSGTEVFAALRAKDPRIKIVLLTALPPDDERVRACAAQAYALLRKPDQLKDVRDLLA